MINNNITLPEAFLSRTVDIMGQEIFARFLDAFHEEPPVSIRLNPRKMKSEESPSSSFITYHFSLITHHLSLNTSAALPIPWCPEGFYLSQRPNYTFDPLFHAGCYYVQEAASQFIVHCAQYICQQPQPLREGRSLPLGFALDLCAAPGGKSTALRSVLPDDWLLVSNEPIRKRAQILNENMEKWGHPNCLVTNNYPQDFLRSGLKETFDLILCDVPCSGEGMFRKDPAAISEWSPQNVERCWQLQRQIVGDIWPCLRTGGVMIYSTCTFNTKENEENVKWILENFDAELIAVPTLPDWGICGSLLEGFDAPVYRFIPGLTRSEGLFVAVLRKKGDEEDRGGTKKTKAITTALARLNKMESSPCAEALSTTFDPSRHTVVELDYNTAIAYLRREAIVLPPDTPRGIVVVTYQGHPLGIAKNIGSRANNLYPREWAIKSTYSPTTIQ